MGKILVVDDDQNICELLRLYIEKEGYSVVIANEGNQAVAMAESENPDLILLDIMLPGLDGWQVCREVRKKSQCPIIMLTAKGEVFDKVLGLELGADDYVVKPFSLEELAARVDAHLRRERRRGTASELRFDGQLVINYTDRRVTWAGHELGLVRREFDIVEFLSQNPGMVFDRERIYECVWGIDGEGDSAVISEHVRRIRAKFAAAGCERQYIETVWGVGYRWAR